MQSYNQMLETEQEAAACLSNSHGRLVAGNKKFCRMFGLATEEVEWHYLPDFYRSEGDWKAVRHHVDMHGELRNFYVRLRNRRGRSFACLLDRLPVSMPNGSLLFLNTVQKVSMSKAADPGVLDVRKLKEAARGVSQVFLVSCHACSRVKDGAGQWIAPPGHTARSAKGRLPEYCPECAARLFPDFNPEAEVHPELLARQS